MCFNDKEISSLQDYLELLPIEYQSKNCVGQLQSKLLNAVNKETVFSETEILVLFNSLIYSKNYYQISPDFEGINVSDYICQIKKIFSLLPLNSLNFREQLKIKSSFYTSVNIENNKKWHFLFKLMLEYSMDKPKGFVSILLRSL